MNRPGEHPAPLRIRFDEYLLDEGADALFRGGERLPVEPKPFALLVLLAGRRPQLVSFEEIQRRLWPGVTVDRSARDRVISQARRAVGDTGGRQRVIRTHRGRGLSFAAPVVDATAQERLEADALPIGNDAPLIGRDGVMEALAADLARLGSGAGGCVLLEGEAGIGKTRIARELGEQARSHGVGVHWSRAAADPADAGPGWIWRQLLQSLRVASPLPSVERALEGLRALARASGGSAQGGHDVPPVGAQLGDALWEALTAACAQKPRLFIVDDLHAADAASLQLVRLLAPLFESAAGLLVVTWREEAPDGAALSATRRAFAGAGWRRLRLPELSRDEVARLVEAALGAPPSAAVLAALHERCGGNPFFVSEVVRRLGARPPAPDAFAELEVPPGIALVLDERLERLAPPAREVLAWAAVCGHEPEPRVISRAAGFDENEVAMRLREALAAGLLRRSGRGLRFSHGLLVEHLCNPADPRLAARHWAVAEALESLYGDRAERWGEIARHRRRGLAAGSAETAVEAAQRAGRHALARRAYDDAADHLSDALHASLDDPGTTHTRAELLLELGRAQLRANRRDEAAQAFDETAAIARRTQDWTLLSRAALGYAGLPSTLAGDHKAQLERVREALGRLDEREGGLRARLLSRQAALCAAQGDTDAAQALAQQAVALARRLDDPATLGSTLHARNAVLVGDVLRSAERIAHADESLAHAERTANETLMLDARLHRAVALLHDGNVHAFRAEMSGYLSRARELGHPLLEYYGTLAGVTGRVLDGRLDEAEPYALAAHAIGRRAEHPDCDLHLAIQIAQLRFLQGRLGEGVDRLEQLAGATPLLGMQAALALALGETDRQRKAAGLLPRLVVDFAAAPRDSGWLSNGSVLALVAWRVGDVAAAERLAGLLEPYADKTVSAFLVSCNGATSYFLGLLAQVRGRHAEARARLDAAVDANEAMGARPWLLRSQIALAQTLAETSQERDRTAALGLARRAGDEAERLGMRPSARAARELTSRLTQLGYQVDPSESWH